MAHAQKPYFVFRRNGQVHLNRRGLQFCWILAAEVCVSAVVMLDTPCSEVVSRVLATYSIHQFPLHFPSRASPCAITSGEILSLVKNLFMREMTLPHYLTSLLELTKRCHFYIFCVSRKILIWERGKICSLTIPIINVCTIKFSLFIKSTSFDQRGSSSG
jgi:hypothetical protein